MISIGILFLMPAGYKITMGTSPTNGSIVNNFDVGLALSYNPVNSLPFWNGDLCKNCSLQ
jgi:hypothetical protein